MIVYEISALIIIFFSVLLSFYLGYKNSFRIFFLFSITPFIFLSLFSIVKDTIPYQNFINGRFYEIPLLVVFLTITAISFYQIYQGVLKITDYLYIEKIEPLVNLVAGFLSGVFFVNIAAYSLLLLQLETPDFEMSQLLSFFLSRY